MGCVWFSVFVILTLQQVFARDCPELSGIKKCDDCIRCGGIWCNSPNTHIRCSKNTDQFCPLGREELVSDPGSSEDIDLIDADSPVYLVRTVAVSSVVSNGFLYPGKIGSQPTVDITIVNNTKGLNPKHFNTKINYPTYDEDLNGYSSIIEAIPTTNFCEDSGNIREEITLKFKANSGGNYASITYNVPCACDCTSIVDVNSAQCNKRGNFSCGICRCKEGWKGDSCEEVDSPSPINCGDRGDISSCNHPYTGLVCSGNGKCTCGGRCECYTDIVGHQYFDEYCTDLCTIFSSYCDNCLRNPSLGHCDECSFDMYMESFNNTLMENVDDQGRKIWVECVEKTDDCDIKYAAMKEENGVAHVMVIDLCAPVASKVAGAVNVTVPVILGVLALVAAAAAAGAYVFWKNREPPLTASDLQYTNIEAENCTGENPIYKPPTSYFKNPTYNRW